MKRIIFAALIVLGPRFAMATGPAVYKSSNTATAETAKALCTGGAPFKKGYLHTACVNTGTAGTLTLYAAHNTGANPIAAIDTAAKGCQIFDVVTSSGLTYTNSATANVTISYDCQ